MYHPQQVLRCTYGIFDADEMLELSFDESRHGETQRTAHVKILKEKEGEKVEEVEKKIGHILFIKLQETCGKETALDTMKKKTFYITLNSHATYPGSQTNCI